MKTKFIKGFLGYYSINNYGEIYSFRSKRVLKNTLDKTTGYYKICLYSRDKCKNFYIHRLLAEHFIHNPENKPFVNHKNGDRGDNRLSNLEWCTNAENVRFSRGLKTRKSKYKGVCFKGNRYQAEIFHNKKHYYLGSFIRAKDAAKAYDKKAKELFGKFAWLNLKVVNESEGKG